MILNNAVIERMMIDDKTYTSTKEFIDALLACKDLIADVYVNNQLVTSGLLNLSVNNNWIIGNVDERLSLENLSSADFIRILVHQIGYDYDDVEHIIMSTSSPLSTFIDPGDIDADLYFAVMATVPECTQECHVPESEFNMMGTNNIVPKDFTDKKQCPDDPTVVTEPLLELEPYIVYPGAEPPQIMFSILSINGQEKDFEIKLNGGWEVRADGTAPVKGMLDPESSWEFYVSNNQFVEYIINNDTPSIEVIITTDEGEFTTAIDGGIDGDVKS